MHTYQLAGSTRVDAVAAGAEEQTTMQVIDGSHLLSDRNVTEDKKLKKVSCHAKSLVCASMRKQPRKQSHTGALVCNLS